MNNKILFLTTESPFPLDSGGKIRTYNLIKGINKNFKVDIICFSEKKMKINYIKELETLCNEVRIIKKTFTNNKSKKNLICNVLKSIFKGTPFIIEKFMDKEYAKAIIELQQKNNYLAVIIDHLQISNYKRYITTDNVILSQHNCENLILNRIYKNENNLIKKLYIKMEYLKTLSYERKICSLMKKVIVLSSEDKNYIIGANYIGDNMRIVPISIESEYIKRNHNNEVKNILFMGTMSWYPNEQGITWFMDNVWEQLKEELPQLNLYIVGKDPSDKIKKYNNDSVIITGYVNNVNEYIEKCDLCIVPLFIGGGMRVKILECMAKGIPCISTAIGAEGIKYTNMKDIIIANNANEFIDKIKLLSNSEKLNEYIAQNGLNNVNENYSISMIGKSVLNIINESNK